MAGRARAGGETWEIVAVRREGKRDRIGKLRDGVIGGARADTEAADDDRDARDATVGRLGGGAGVNVERPRAVAGDAGDRAVAGIFDEPRVDGGRRAG